MLNLSLMITKQLQVKMTDFLCYDEEVVGNWVVACNEQKPNMHCTCNTP